MCSETALFEAPPSIRPVTFVGNSMQLRLEEWGNRKEAGKRDLLSLLTLVLFSCYHIIITTAYP